MDNGGMTTYDKVKDRPQAFLALTSLTVKEFQHLLPAFIDEYAAAYPPTLRLDGRPRVRRAGGGRKARLATMADKLLFVLTYHKTYPLQTVLGQCFGLSQSQANEWLQRLTPVLKRTLARLGYAPLRDPAAMHDYDPETEGVLLLLIDGTERRRQRPKNPEKQRAHYSGKKKTHTDKNVLLANERTGEVIYLSQTYAGKTHDKKAAVQEGIQYPDGAVLTKDTGFQGYNPVNVHSIQPKKTPKGGWLSHAERLANRVIARARIKVEHVLAGVKRCRSVKDVLRNTCANFSDWAMQIACALHNLRVNFRQLSLPIQST